MPEPAPDSVTPASPDTAKGKATALTWRFFISSLRIVLLLLIMLAWFQRSLIYHPAKVKELPAAGSQLAHAVFDVTVKSHDGLTLHGWLMVAGQPKSALPVDPKTLLKKGRTLVIVFPGNAGHRAYRSHLLHTFGELGVDAMIFDYRGYGENPGKPSEANFAKDARTGWDFATKTLGVSPRQIVFYGESLGGGSAVRLASDLCRDHIEPGGLIVQSTFNSLVAAGGHHFPILPVNLLLIDRFESSRHITAVTCPILQLHGERDRIVPVSLGQKLFDAAPALSSRKIPQRQVLLPNSDHNDVYGPDLPLVVDALRAFLKQVATQVAH